MSPFAIAAGLECKRRTGARVSTSCRERWPVTLCHRERPETAPVAQRDFSMQIMQKSKKATQTSRCKDTTKPNNLLQRCKWQFFDGDQVTDAALS
jgi:hypothetical protein